MRRHSDRRLQLFTPGLTDSWPRSSRIKFRLHIMVPEKSDDSPEEMAEDLISLIRAHLK
jgi:hypothetical protein